MNKKEIKLLRTMSGLKVMLLLLPFMLYSCIGTDEVEDNLGSIEIVPPNNVGITNNGSFAKLVGQQTAVAARGTSDLGGEFILTDVNWESSNTSVLTIDEDGNVSSLQSGMAMITASALGITSDPIMVSVASNENVVALIEVTAANEVVVVAPGETLQLSGQTLNVNGDPIGGSTITWSSSNESIATIDEIGLVMAISDGSVRITASSDGIISFIDLTIGTPNNLSRTAQFSGLTGYRASGSATLSANSNGTLTLTLSNDFSVQRGPGLYLYLSPSATRIATGFEIGRLRNTSGSDEYPILSNVELNEFNHVIIYCKPFGVGFGTGELSTN